MLSGSQEVSFDERIEEDEADPFFGCSTFDSPTMIKRDSIQGVDSGMPETANKQLQHSAVLREVEFYLDPQLQVPKKLIHLDGGESIDSSFHALLLLRGNGFPFPALRLHLNVFSLIVEFH